MAVNLWWEVWPRPGSATFLPIIKDVPTQSSSYHEGLGQIGDGNMALPEDFDTSILADPSIPSGSLLRLMAPSGQLGEWLLTQTTPTQDADDPTVEAQGVGPNSLLAYARLEPYDWDGSDDFTPTFPDWIWGGRNLLSNPGFENSVQTSTRYQLTITATGGTYTLSDGTDTTSAISWNASAATIETRLETDIAAISDVLVTPISGGFQIEFVNPPFDINLTVNPASLTGGTATLAITFFGSYQPTPWTKSQQVSFGLAREFGLYDNFRVVGPSTSPSGPVHSGNFSLWINPGPVTSSVTQFAGAQQIVRVSPGGTYQAGIWVYSVTGGDYRLVIRGIDEDLIARVDATVPAATWTLVSISDVVMETADGYQPDQVIFRFANTEPSGTPSDFYLDDAYLEEGLAPTTIGEILRLIYEDATVDHAGRVVWEDQANPGNPYLVLNFTDTHDSHGQPWDRSDVRIKFPMRMNYSQIMAQVSQQFQYEYEVKHNAGVWEWSVYNPGTLGTDRSATISLIAGTTETRRLTAVKLPGATNVMIEGSDRVTSRAEDAGLVAALGRIEGAGYQPDAEDLPVAAAAALDRAETLQESYQLTFVSPDFVPFIDYQIGDLVRVLDPPLDQVMRVLDVNMAMTADRQEWLVQLGSVVLSGEAAMAQAVGAMLPASPIHRPAGAFERADAFFDGGSSLLIGGGGGAPTVVVAASDASDLSKSKADFVCTGTNDERAIQTAVDLLATTGGKVVLTEGQFSISNTVSLPTVSGSAVHLQGLGRAVTRFSRAAGSQFLDVGGFAVVSDIEFVGNTTVAVAAAVDAPRVVIRDCAFTVNGVVIRLGGDGWQIHDNAVVPSGFVPTYFVQDLDGYEGTLVVNNAARGAVDMGDGVLWNVSNNLLLEEVIADGGHEGVIADNAWFASGGQQEGNGKIVVRNFANATISGNVIPSIGNGAGVLLDTVTKGVVVSNQMESGDIGIHILDSEAIVVSGNHAQWCIDANYHVDGSTNCLLVGNVAVASDGSNYLVDGDANYLTGNASNATAGFSTAAVGYNINSGTGNIYAGNQAEGTYGTAAYVDNGTSSVNTYPSAGGAQGDNFV